MIKFVIDNVKLRCMLYTSSNLLNDYHIEKIEDHKMVNFIDLIKLYT